MARNRVSSEEEVFSSEYFETDSEQLVKPDSEKEEEEEEVVRIEAAQKEDVASRVAKKAKTSNEAATVVEVKPILFQRVWTEQDEICVLQGMLDFALQKKGDPLSNLTSFLEFVKPNIHFDVNKSQLQDKIKRLKKKYENNKSRDKDGKKIMCSNPHELKSYHLSKLIWGKENGRRVEDCKAVQRMESHSFANMEERVLIAAQSLGLERTEEWKQLREKEFKLYRKQLEVRIEQVKYVLEAMKGRK